MIDANMLGLGLPEGNHPGLAPVLHLDRGCVMGILT